MERNFLIFGFVMAAFPALMAYGCYRAGAFFDWRYRWRKREEAPRYFWVTLAGYILASILFAAFGVFVYLQPVGIAP